MKKESVIKMNSKRNYFYIILAISLGLFVGKIPLSVSITNIEDAVLTSSGQVVLGVLVFAIILWITEAIPFHITGLLSIFLLTICRVDSFKSIVQVGFGNHIIIFFIGILIHSAFVDSSGLGKRISVFLLSKTGNNTKMIILGFLIIGTLLSMWMTDMAVAAILTPLAVVILKEEKIKPMKSNFGKALLIACAWGPIVGGIGTPAGGGANALTIGFLKDLAGINISFLDWMIYGIPAALLLIIPVWGIILLFFKPELKSLSRSKEDLKTEFKKLPKFSKEEKATTIIFLLTVFLWLITPIIEKLIKLSIPISMPVLFTSSLYFLPKVTNIKWKDIEKKISWNGIILVVSGISLGMMLYDTGAAEWISLVLLGKIIQVNLFIQILIIILVVSILKVALSSNTVTATIIIPIIIALTQNLGIEILPLALPAGITTSLAFILVTSTPTNIIPYSAGYFSISDMAKAGVTITIISSLIVAAVIFLIGNLVNLF